MTESTNQKSEKEVIETKDYWEIIFLTAQDISPIKIEAKPDDDPQYLVYTFDKEVEFLLDALARGVVEYLMLDFRKVRNAIEQFKQNMHRYLPHKRRS